jgi:hypothetical protein
MLETTIASGLIDWEELTGQSKFVIDIVSIPIFSAIAGLITNWTGVIMLFSPTHFTGFYVPGLKTLFPLLPRKIQILPTFAPNGILGFQGFIPCRAEKMASLMVDMSIARIGSIGDFYQQLEPDKMADLMAEKMRPSIRRIATDIIRGNHGWLWQMLPAPAQESVLATVDQRLPDISQTAFAKVGEHIDELLDVKLMTVNHLRRNPKVLSDIFRGMGDPELRFMVKIGALGALFGIPLALYLSWIHYYHPPVIGAVPSWIIVLGGAATIGVIVNILAIKVIFEPGDPKRSLRYPWKQGLFPKRQYEAAAQVATMMAEKVLTVTNFTRELLFGASGDKTAGFLAETIAEEVERLFTPFGAAIGKVTGAVDMEEVQRGASEAIVEFAPEVFYSEEFNDKKAKTIADFATDKFRKLPPAEFSEMLYAAIEQDAWLLYAHGGLLGILVGSVHLLLFGG